MTIDWSEHYIKQGNPRALTYYIIRRADSGCGLFSNYNVFAGHIRHALSKGWLPVIDMQNYPNAYLAPELLCKENSWEYYFEQPFGLNLNQAYEGENVVLSYGDWVAPTPAIPDDLNFYYNKNNVLTEWRTIIKLGLMKIKPQLQQEIDATFEKLFAPDDRILGVLLRGTDYLANKPFLHAIPPPLSLQCHML